jgi:hypothetical protein
MRRIGPRGCPHLPSNILGSRSDTVEQFASVVLPVVRCKEPVGRLGAFRAARLVGHSLGCDFHAGADYEKPDRDFQSTRSRASVSAASEDRQTSYRPAARRAKSGRPKGLIKEQATAASRTRRSLAPLNAPPPASEGIPSTQGMALAFPEAPQWRAYRRRHPPTMTRSSNRPVRAAEVAPRMGRP